ncbi:DNA modification system-associated small protein [Nitrogeniibacter aestuarii]|uniref:DNA modification system-associated small protein n=1 Tax=Nitrogeniibacter aestuarii TaxID=2815343 RepID=UPI001E429144|nr:DNA modification system-associated small protein [Nitrogeniibacter aestuarii]
MSNDHSEREDLALATLRAVAIEGEVHFPADLVEKLYRLQKRHQFDSDRSASVQEMQRLLEQYVDSLAEGTSK